MGLGNNLCPSNSLNWMDRTPDTPVNKESSPTEASFPKVEEHKTTKVKEEKIQCDNCHSHILKCNLIRHKKSQRCQKYKA